MKYEVTAIGLEVINTYNGAGKNFETTPTP
ncbi:predicted protein [Sclerotinia sclerotiorum 1980 UF-70]|uniref:Uncharacterized protein n=1 Tax=Sclerotinia sclerotiorum (strain ATCC 18683 / 1980 / Ss-1) TaxID=665079 RepID=A7EH42_SCLS1|nr:predicted protein [Sclerotinia sclerotiorum 1980 UF-70]EDO02158.1 predicted protein [Sclerotinia sclerotiorum 1980 UF-70]